MASEYLQRFDRQESEDSKSAEAWINEFLSVPDAGSVQTSIDDQNSLADHAENTFARYEQEWRRIQQLQQDEQIYTFSSSNPYVSRENLLSNAQWQYSNGNIADAILCKLCFLHPNL